MTNLLPIASAMMVAIIAALFLGALVFGIADIATGSTSEAAFITAALVLVAVGALQKTGEKNRRTYASLISKTDAVIASHEKALVRKRLQKFHLDDYGEPIYGDWEKEINYFIDKILHPSLDKPELAAFDRRRTDIINHVESKVAPLATAHESAFDANMSPLEFEQFCAQRLRGAGWLATVTKASGDQGSDVIADKGPRRLILQCKLYERPVGNQAVQEVSAARLHERGDYAAVVSNASYTAAARRLALTNDVLLLHYADLDDIDGLLQ